MLTFAPIIIPAQPLPSFVSIRVVPEAVVLSSTFQGTAVPAESQRPPLILDFPLWKKGQATATLEDMELTCERPTTVSKVTPCVGFHLVWYLQFLNEAILL